MVTGVVIQADGGIDGLGDPVQGHVGEELVFAETPLDVPCTVAPGTELLHDPGRQSHRRVVEPVGQGLRPGALDMAVGPLLVLPVLAQGAAALRAQTWRGRWALGVSR